MPKRITGAGVFRLSLIKTGGKTANLAEVIERNMVGQIRTGVGRDYDARELASFGGFDDLAARRGDV